MYAYVLDCIRSPELENVAKTVTDPIDSLKETKTTSQPLNLNYGWKIISMSENLGDREPGVKIVADPSTLEPLVPGHLLSVLHISRGTGL